MEKENLSAIMDELFATTDVPTIENNPDFYDEEESGIVDYNPDEADDEERDEYADDMDEEPETYDLYDDRGEIDEMIDRLRSVYNWFTEQRYEEYYYDICRDRLQPAIDAVNDLYSAAGDWYDG